MKNNKAKEKIIMAILHINENNFNNEVLESSKPVLLDFSQHGADTLQNAWTEY